MTDQAQPAELFRAFMEHSPFGLKLGIAGRSICSVEVEAFAGDEDAPVAKALVTYKLKLAS